jgi:hypothetical protein
LRYGRAWLRLFGCEAHWEWHFFRRTSTFGFSLDLAQGDSEAIGGNIQLAEIGRMIVADADSRIAQLEKRIVGRLYINS